MLPNLGEKLGTPSRHLRSLLTLRYSRKIYPSILSWEGRAAAQLGAANGIFESGRRDLQSIHDSPHPPKSKYTHLLATFFRSKKILGRFSLTRPKTDSYKKSGPPKDSSAKVALRERIPSRKCAFRISTFLGRCRPTASSRWRRANSSKSTKAAAG